MYNYILNLHNKQVNIDMFRKKILINAIVFIIVILIRLSTNHIIAQDIKTTQYIEINKINSTNTKHVKINKQIKIFVTNNLIKNIIENISNETDLIAKSIKCSGCVHHCYFTNEDIKFLKEADMLIYANKDQESYTNKLISQQWFIDKFSFNKGNLIGFDNISNFDYYKNIIEINNSNLNYQNNINAQNNNALNLSKNLANLIEDIQHEYFYLNIQNLVNLTNVIAKIIPINQQKYLDFIEQLNAIHLKISNLNLNNTLIYSEKLLPFKSSNNTLILNKNESKNNIQKYKCVLIDSHYNKLLKYDNFIILSEISINSNILVYLNNIIQILSKCKNI
ncbi:MAG: hypothetical protein U1E31_01125 [Rickettsiales bacterium]